MRDLAPCLRPRELPLSAAQERAWLREQTALDPSLHTSALAIRIRGALDSGALVAAFNQLALRHEILRTVIDVAGARRIQLVTARPHLERRAVSAPSVRHAGAELDATLRMLVEPTFDLREGPLFRAHLLRVTETDHALVLVVHHAVGDARSLELLLAELAAHYRGEALPPPAVQYADVTMWLREWLDVPAEHAYWDARLLGAAPLALPTDRPRAASPSCRAASHPITLAGSRAQVAGAWHTVLARLAGQDELVTAVPVTARLAGMGELVGPFDACAPVRVELAGAGSREITRRVTTAIAESRAHPHVPPIAPLRAACILTDALPPAPSFGAARTERIAVVPSAIPFELALVLRDGVGAIEFHADLFAQATIETIATRLRAAIASAEPSTALFAAAAASLP
ncbi:MAG TPA: condensation domain-containing protein [Kofleriaceae bacterium]